MFSIAEASSCNECLGSFQYPEFRPFAVSDFRDYSSERGSTPSGGFPGWRANVYKFERLKQSYEYDGIDS
jgi:hypothetical protein